MKPTCVISCPIDTFSGYGARSRDFVRSLIQAKKEKWNIYIMPQKWGDCPWGALSSNDPLKSLFRSSKDFNDQPDIWIQITIPNEFQRIGKYNIGVSAGIETNLYPGDFIEGLNRMDLNLVSSTHSKDVALATSFEKIDNKTNQVVSEVKLEKPIEVLFEGLDLNIFHKKPPTCMDIKTSKILESVEEDFCFLFTGHWLNGALGEDRKNVGLMIKAFLETFSGPGNKKPALILKANHIDYSTSDEEAIIEHIYDIKNNFKNNPPNIYLIHGELTDKEMNLLNNDPKVKAFLNFAKGEGFGRPLLEGAITGKPTIASNWSGHLDFLKPEYNILIGGELKNVHASAANKWLMKESYWFSIDIDVAKRAMKDVFKHYKKYLKKSRKQTQYIKDNWSIDKMLEKINELIPEINPTQTLDLKLPKLKKINNFKEEKLKLPKLKLPKLKKIEA